MANRLNIPFFPQRADGYCLAACTQMVFSYLGISRSQASLARQLGLIKGAGIRASHITSLSSASLTAIFETGTLADLQRWIAYNIPVIAFVDAGELPHHAGHHFQHALVIIGFEDDTVYLLDPDTDGAPIQTPIGDFLLAWSEMDYKYAVIQARL